MPYQVIYSETSGKIIRRLHPSIKPLIRQKIDALRENPSKFTTWGTERIFMIFLNSC